MLRDEGPLAGRADQLNLETGRIHWVELQRHFAKGVVIAVDDTLDLTQIAAAFVDDDHDRVASLMNAKRIWKADLNDAKRWNDEGAEFWAVVAAPWVLVQRFKGEPRETLL